MGRKTISLSSSNVSAPNKSVTSNSSSISTSKHQQPSITRTSTNTTNSTSRKSLTPDIPASSSSSVPSPAAASSVSSSIGECSTSTSQSKLPVFSSSNNPPVKRPRSVGAAASSKPEAAHQQVKKHRALLSTSALQPQQNSLFSNEASSSSSSVTRKRPSSSNSNSEFVEKQLKTDVFDQDSADFPDSEESSSKSYWLRSRSSSSMKRVSNAGSETGGARSSKQQQPSGNANTEQQGSSDQQKLPTSTSKQEKSSGKTSGSGILASLVGSQGGGSKAASGSNSRPSLTKQSTSSSSSNKAGASSRMQSSGNSSKTQNQQQAPSTSRRGGHGTKMLSSTSSSSTQQGGPGKLSSPRESGRHASGSGKQNSSGAANNPNLSEVAASFASAAAAMNAISSGSSGGSSGIPTLPPGAASGDASGAGASGTTGAANLLRQFGKFLSRGASNSGPTSARAMTLINQLQSAAFDTEQLQCLQDLCDIINMNTEDTLQEFPARQAAMVLTELMSGASGFEVAISACRALTYMLDCVPHAAKFVTIDTVRCLISKLNDIECIDIAEQALSALEFLSASHHSKAILRAGGVAACLQFIDFFSTLCQQKSLTIVANCCIGITPTDFAQIRDSIDRLSQQLLNQDRKCVELVSLSFSYIVSGCERDESVVREVASHGFLLNAQQVLVQTPPVVGPAVYCQIFNTLSTICRQCPDQTVQLLLQNFPSTLAFLLTGNREALHYTNDQPTVLLSSGNTPGGVCSGSQELQEIVTLISELLPPQPDEELFNTFPSVPSHTPSQNNPLSAASQYMAAFLQSPFEWTENPFSFLAGSHAGDDDDDADPTAQALLAMQSAVMGTRNNASSQAASSSSQQNQASSNSQSQSQKSSILADLFAEKPQLFHGLVANLTGPLLDICQTTTAGTIELKAKCLETLQRLLLVAPDSVLDAMIRAADLSSCLAQFLTLQNASDLRVAGLALQICHLLVRRCPELFASQAVKQGISHQIVQTLAFVTSETKSEESGAGSGSSSRPGSGEFNAEQEPGEIGGDEQGFGAGRRANSRLSGGGKNKTQQNLPQKSTGEPSTSSNRVVRSSSRGSNKPDLSTSSSIGAQTGEEDSSIAASSFRKLRSTVKSVLSRGKAAVGGQPPASSQPSGSGPSTSRGGGGQGTRKSTEGSPNLQTQGGRRGGVRGGGQSGRQFVTLQQQVSETQVNFNAQLKAWIAQWAKLFLDKLEEVVRKSEEEKNSGVSSSTGAFSSLKSAANALSNETNNQAPLIEIRDLIMTQDFSLFELGSSGLTESLVKFLGSARPSQLRAFLRLFAVLPPGLELCRDGVRSPESFSRPPMAELVGKLVGCLQQIEQFEVKSATVRDRTPTSIFTSSGLMPSSLLAAAMTSSGGANSGAAAFSVSPVVRFFSTCSLKLELRRSQPQTTGNNNNNNQATPGGGKQQAQSGSRLSSSNSVPSCLVRIDPLLTVDVLSRWIVQKGLHSNSGPLSGLGAYRAGRNQANPGSNVQQSRSPLESGADTSSVSGAEDFDDGDSSIADFSSTMTDDGGMSSGPETGGPNTGGAAPSSNTQQTQGDGAGSSSTLRDSGRSSHGSGGTGQVQVELLLDDVILPPEMTLYQAVAQFGLGLTDEALFSLSSTDTLFQTPHAINFRIRGSVPAEESKDSQEEAPESRKRSKSVDSRKSNQENRDISLASLGILDEFLRKPQNLSSLAGLEVVVSQILSLMRMLYGLNRYWYSLFDVTSTNFPEDDAQFWFPSAPVKSLLAVEEFISPKLNLKAHRQLRDTFVLATGIVPKWLQQVCSNWPFLLSYDVRQQIFYLTTFGRDRGILRLNHHAATSGSANPPPSSNQANSTSNTTTSGTSPGTGAGSNQVGGAFSGANSLSASDQAVNTWLSRIVRSVEKRRYEVSRSQLLADAMRVLKQSSTPAFRSSIVEIQYKNEVGVGLGPTLEFYALVSRQLQSPELDLWHAHSLCNQPGAFLYPKSHNTRSLSKSSTQLAEQHGGAVEIFRFLGQFVARAIVDGRMVDLNFNPLFIDRLLMAQYSNQEFHPLPTDLLWVDRVLARSVAQLVQISRNESSDTVNDHLEDLMLDFEVPGRPDADISGDNPSFRGPLNANNLQAYISALLEFFLSSGIADFLSAFCDGFNSVFPIDSLRRFFCSPSEIEAFLGGSNDMVPWDAQLLREAIRPDHGYNQDSPVLQWLIDMLVQLDYVQRRLFLQFSTGTPRLPLGGFAALSPPLTVVRRALEQSANPDDFLPSVMTCANYLKMPEYSSPEIMRRKLLLAITDGQETFHLS